jgi:hypothetical protein
VEDSTGGGKAPDHYPMRQAWINKLRERIATFRSMSIDFAYPSSHEHFVTFNLQKLLEVYEEIKLLLNIEEPDHKALGRAIETTLHALTDKKTVNFEQLTASGVELTAIAQKVLTQEWEVTKKMEMDVQEL